MQLRRITPGLLPLLLFGMIVLAASAAHGATDPSAGSVSPDLSEIRAIPQHGRTYVTMLVLLQLAAMLVAAKLLGWLAERVSIPGVIGELLAGVLIGPFVLGNLLRLPLHGGWVPLFPPPAPGQWPVNEIVWSIAQFASILLLFITGLHTDLKQFLRYAAPASLVALAGAIVPFALGVAVIYIPFFADLARGAPGEPALVAALFVGLILMATSVGITARVLSDIQKLDTPEGVTIIAAAVLDDVIGIVALAIVGGIAATGTVSWGAIGVVSGKAVGVWVGLTIVTLVLAGHIERALRKVRYTGAVVALALALAFACSAIAEFFGLAFIIGAYSVGLGLSRTKIAHELMDRLQPIADFLVPIFFCTLGMLVDFRAMFSNWGVILMGTVVTLVAIVGKLGGCGLAALPVGFNRRGAWRIGLGMLPRGEVALIVAGVGLSQNIIGQNVFGVSIMMTLVTTILAPILLVPAFQKGGHGRRRIDTPTDRLPSGEVHRQIEFQLPPDLADVFVGRLLKRAGSEGWQVTFDQAEQEIYLLRSGDDAAHVSRVDGKIVIGAAVIRQKDFAALVREVGESIAIDIEGSRQPAPEV